LFDNNTKIGTAGLKIIDKIKNIGELKCMYVLSEYHGQGFGFQLLEKVKEVAIHKGITIVKLDVKKNADKAIHLYVKSGFDEIPRYNDNQNDIIFME